MYIVNIWGVLMSAEGRLPSLLMNFFTVIWVGGHKSQHPLGSRFLWFRLLLTLFILPLCLALLKLWLSQLNHDSLLLSGGFLCTCTLTRSLLFNWLATQCFLCLTDRKAIFFNSHNVSKPESSSDLTSVSSVLSSRQKLLCSLKL